jgi:hypothetical protein
VAVRRCGNGSAARFGRALEFERSSLLELPELEHNAISEDVRFV